MTGYVLSVLTFVLLLIQERIQADMDWSSCVMDRFLSPVDWPEKRYTEEELEQMMSSEDERELP